MMKYKSITTYSRIFITKPYKRLCNSFCIF